MHNVNPIRSLIGARFIAGVALALAGSGLSGCTSTALEPAASSQQVSDMANAARTSVEGIRVTVQDAQWTGDAAINQEVTPLRVAIRNDGEQPVRIAYEQFRLVSPEGLISSALPLFEIDGSVREPVALREYPAVTRPGYLHTNFGVAPYLADVYRDIPASVGPFYYNDFYYGSHLTHWEQTQLPTAEMRMNALPEGVLETGGRVEGWLYFKNIDDARRVVFRADLVNSNTGTEIGEVRIPFEKQ